MMPADLSPHADEVGSPDDGRGQAPPVKFSGTNTYALTREPVYMQTFGKPSPLIDYRAEP